jgi:2-dehydro-3-deoxygalactonokinase
MQSAETCHTVAIDWGTTHRRAYALDAAGQCLSEHADADGALACKGRFPEALASGLQALNATPQRVLMSGMVGSALGWQEVPYVTGDVSLTDLAKHLAEVPAAPGRPRQWIVPGYCVRDAFGQPDVMRGEETQLLGAVTLGHASGWFVLPGTHSKWVQLQDGQVRQLRTYLTGELFNLLGQHGTLAAAIGAHAQDWDTTAFADGVKAAANGALSHALFGTRARVVTGDMPASQTKAYLSGLLIGTELHDVLRNTDPAGDTAPFKLIGSPELAIRYEAAAALLGLRFEVLDARAAFLSAMAFLQSQLDAT